MKKIILFTILSFIICNINAQYIDNKLNIYFGYKLGGFSGKETTENDGLSFPSLFNNFESTTALTVKGLYNYHPIYSFGLGFDYLDAKNWQSSEYQTYNDSEVKQYSASAIFQLHTKKELTGLFSRIKLYFELYPTLGVNKTNLEQYPGTIYDENGNEITPSLSSSDTFWGLGGSPGAELTISEKIGIYTAYSYQYCKIDSKLFNDNHFVTSQLTFGVIIRLVSDKNYLYK